MLRSLAAKSKLQAFLAQYDKDLKSAKLPPEDSRSAPAVGAGILARFENTVSALRPGSTSEKNEINLRPALADLVERRPQNTLVNPLTASPIR